MWVCVCALNIERERTHFDFNLVFMPKVSCMWVLPHYTASDQLLSTYWGSFSGHWTYTFGFQDLDTIKAWFQAFQFKYIISLYIYLQDPITMWVFYLTLEPLYFCFYKTKERKQNWFFSKTGRWRQRPLTIDYMSQSIVRDHSNNNRLLVTIGYV